MAFGRIWAYGKHSYGTCRWFAYNFSNFEKWPKIEKCQHSFQRLDFALHSIQDFIYQPKLRPDPHTHHFTAPDSFMETFHFRGMFAGFEEHLHTVGTWLASCFPHFIIWLPLWSPIRRPDLSWGSVQRCRFLLRGMSQPPLSREQVCRQYKDCKTLLFGMCIGHCYAGHDWTAPDKGVGRYLWLHISLSLYALYTEIGNTE